MNSWTLLIIGAPAVLLAIAHKLQERDRRRADREWDICWGGPGKRPSAPKKRTPDWQWPSREWARSETEELR